MFSDMKFPQNGISMFQVIGLKLDVAGIQTLPNVESVAHNNQCGFAGLRKKQAGLGFP